VHDTAIGEDGGRCEVARPIPGKKADHPSNLLRTRHATHRYRLVQLGELCWILHCSDIDWRRDGARTHPDHEDVVSGELEPEVRVSIRMPPFDRQ